MILLLVLMLCSKECLPRSIYRTQESDTPTIFVEYLDTANTKPNKLSSFLLQGYSIFKLFSQDYFCKHHLPDEITVDNDKIHTNSISQQIEFLLTEIEQNKKSYRDFKILKKSFNTFRKHGFLVLKFKNLPLILKLFIETPYSLTHPYEKCFEERGIFTMGGTNRYFLGFTRIPNCEYIKKANRGYDNLSIPTKWYWLPKNVRWVNIKGWNVGTEKCQEISTPAIYGILCEEVNTKTINPNGSAKRYLNFCTKIDYAIDPNPRNFKVYGKTLTILDTEHFPTMIGAKKQIKHCDKYTSWYVKVAGIYLRNGYFSSKITRKKSQQQEHFYQL